MRPTVRSASPSSARSTSRPTATSSTRTRGARPRDGGSTRRSSCSARTASRRRASSSRRTRSPPSATRSRSSCRRRTRSSSRRTRRGARAGCAATSSSASARSAGSIPVEHVVVDLAREGGPANVLVIANETVVGPKLLDRIRERAGQSPASFLILSPQSDAERLAASRRRPAAAPDGRASCAARGSTSTARSRIPIPTRPRCRRCTTSASTRSSSPPSRARSCRAGCAAT